MAVIMDSYHWICELVEREAGNVLGEQKAYLVDARIAPVAQSLNHSSIDELVEQLQRRPDSELELKIVEAMLIHETSFFRDAHYFEELAEEVIPRLMLAKKNSRELSIWSAACATGQEPYSIAMLLQERFGTLPDWSLRILATDLSRPMLEQARQGIFSDVDVKRGLNPQRQTRFFTKVNERWQARTGLSSAIDFRVHNLIGEDPPVGTFDIVLLRNILIYLNEEARSRVFQQVLRSLAPGGLLMLGATEAMLPPGKLFRRNSAYAVPCFHAIDS